MLKTIASNKKMPLPLKIFQIADVVLQDPAHDIGARNERRLCAVYCAQSSGFEIIHGLLDRIMLMLNVPLAKDSKQAGYHIRPSELPTFFPGRQAEIYYNDKVIGAFGIVHPEVSANFDAPYVSSLLEISIEPFL
jgi:phenylalanyl-tRNA synthetase beta chain